MVTHGGFPVQPEIAVASLYQRNLVTRHTGRAVRLSIEGLVSELGALSLTVLDFGDVSVIDFSCADEVVAKLVMKTLDRDAGDDERFFVFRGVCTHHLDPIESALRRRGLAAAAQSPAGEPFLIGDVDAESSRVWLAVCEKGSASPTELAPELGMEARDCGKLLDRMCARRLLRRDALGYRSLFQTFADAERGLEEGQALGSGPSPGAR